MLLMMLPGSAIACHIILLFIAIIATVLAYCGYSTVVVKAATIANLSHAVYHRLHQQALNDAIAVLPGPPWLLSWLAQIAEQQRATVRQIGKMNEWHMTLHRLLCDISILIQASNPTPIITSLNAFTRDVDHFTATLYNIDGRLTALADNLQRLENAVDGGYNQFQEAWLQELRVLITRAEHTLVEHMLLAEDQLPDQDDLITIRNLPSVLGWITLLTEHTASEDLGYTILHHVNSLANNLIGPTIPRPALAPAPGLAILTLPSRIEFPASHARDEPLDVPHPESYNVLLEPLVHPAGLNQDVNLSTLTWSTGTYHNASYSYTKDGPDHEPQFIRVNFTGHLCIALSKGELW